MASVIFELQPVFYCISISVLLRNEFQRKALSKLFKRRSRITSGRDKQLLAAGCCCVLVYNIAQLAIYHISYQRTTGNFNRLFNIQLACIFTSSDLVTFYQKVVINQFVATFNEILHICHQNNFPTRKVHSCKKKSSANTYL